MSQVVTRHLRATTIQPNFAGMLHSKMLKAVASCFTIALNASVFSQTIGSNFSISENFGHTKIIQSIGQPYALFNSNQKNESNLNQGHILPWIQNETTYSKLEIKIYPNPVVDFTHVELKSKSQIAQIEIHDLNGRKLSEYDFQTPKNYEKINLSNWSAGVYILTVKDTKGMTANLKFTKISTIK